jgi:hypothetical protein
MRNLHQEDAYIPFSHYVFVNGITIPLINMVGMKIRFCEFESIHTRTLKRKVGRTKCYTLHAMLSNTLTISKKPLQ